jgi:hypothetical protein
MRYTLLSIRRTTQFNKVWFSDLNVQQRAYLIFSSFSLVPPGKFGENVTRIEHLEYLVWMESQHSNVDCEAVGWNFLAQDRDELMAFMNTVMNIRIP